MVGFLFSLGPGYHPGIAMSCSLSKHEPFPLMGHSSSAQIKTSGGLLKAGKTFVKCCTGHSQRIQILVHLPYLVHWAAFTGGKVSTVTSPYANVTHDSRYVSGFSRSVLASSRLLRSSPPHIDDVHYASAAQLLALAIRPPR